MKQYIVKKGRSIATGKGIIGAPVDPKHPTEKEIITVKHFGGFVIKGLEEKEINAQTKLDLVLASEKCPLEEYNPGAKTENLGIESDDDTRPIINKLHEVETKPSESKPGENKGAQKK